MTPLRVVHVLGGMVRAGVETWLMNVLRRLDRRRFQLDLLVHAAGPCAYDDEARSLGARLISCPQPQRPWRYVPQLWRALRDNGPYDAVHSHVHHFSGVVLEVARQAGIRIRVAHSHIALLDRGSGPLRRLYLDAAGSWLRRNATAGFAASGMAAVELFGEDWRLDPRWSILPCGIDVGPFAAHPDRTALRRELGIPERALVLGHVGRFDAQKNHHLLVEIAAATARRRPDAHLLMIGEGPLRAEIAALAARLGVAATCTGSRPDIPRLMAAMDVFVFPSRFEGLGVAMVEAQAAGLPVVASRVVPPEATVVPDAVVRLALDDRPERWAEAILAIPRPDAARALAAVTASDFNLANNLDRLLRVYQGGGR
jgi:glycosyltransferase involved in cell wall biosynthesis